MIGMVQNIKSSIVFRHSILRQFAIAFIAVIGVMIAGLSLAAGVSDYLLKAMTKPQMLKTGSVITPRHPLPLLALLRHAVLALNRKASTGARLALEKNIT